MLNTRKSSLLFAIGLISVCVVLVASGRAEDTPAIGAAALRDSIDVLSQSGEFEDAVGIAQELLAAVKADTTSRPFQIADVEYEISRLEYIASLSDSVQKDLAWVAREWQKAVQLTDEYKFEEVDSTVKIILPMVREHMGREYEDEARCLGLLAYARLTIGDFRGAAAYSREGLALQELGRGKETYLYARFLFGLGVIVGDRLDQLSAGEAYLKESVKIMERLWGVDHYEVAETKAWLAGILFAQGKGYDAREISREVIRAVRRSFGNSSRTGIALTNRAFAHAVGGDYETAECWFQEGLSLIKAERGPDDNWVGWNLRLFGVLKMWQGDYDAAEEMLTEALRIHRAIFEDASEQVGWDLYRYAEVLYRKGNYLTAETLARESLDVRVRLVGPDHQFVAHSKTLIGYILIETDHLSEAQRMLAEAQAVYEISGRPQIMVAECYNGQAHILIARGDYTRADSLCRTSLTNLTRYVGDSHPRAIETLTLLGRVHLALENLVEAEKYLDRAARGFELARSRVSTQKFNRTSYAAIASPYPNLAVVKIYLGKNTEAWEVAERDRGRALLDMLTAKDARELTPEELADERRLDGELIRLSGILKVLEADTLVTAAEADSVQNLLLMAQSQWAAYQKKLQEKYPVSEGQSYPLERVQSTLEPGSAVIGWLDTNEGSYAYVVPKTGDVTWVKLTTADPSAAPSRFAQLVSTPGAMADARDRSARRVYGERIAPLSDQIDQLDHIYVVPSGDMASVPIEALISEQGANVIDQRDVTCIPSASVLVWVKEKPAVQSDVSLFAMGDPPFNLDHARAMDESAVVTEVAMVTGGEEWDAIYRGAAAGNKDALGRLERLGGTRREVETIGRLFDSGYVLLGRDASEQEILDRVERDDLVKYRYFHIATHAIPNNDRGLESSLVLSQVDLPDAQLAAMEGERIIDGRLTVGEIVGEWELDADLVTLSACETALGQRTRGEGYVGFAHAFFFAGARTVVLSLWKVADRPTRLLMERFYKNMVTEGMLKSAALRDAKMWLRDLENQQGETPYKDPFYWSAFVLIGDPG